MKKYFVSELVAVILTVILYLITRLVFKLSYEISMGVIFFFSLLILANSEVEIGAADGVVTIVVGIFIGFVNPIASIIVFLGTITAIIIMIASVSSDKTLNSRIKKFFIFMTLLVEFIFLGMAFDQFLPTFL
ncbi:MAG: hypothetical protein PHS07_00490 [Patescibacteria group bacterium]|nr:hypothetical protein [Patescibacteria group bacterium]